MICHSYITEYTMPGNRKECEQYIIKYINDITKDNSNQHLYEFLFARLNDKEFEAFIDKLEKEIEEGKHSLAVEIPIFSKTSSGINFQHLLDVADKRGVKFYKQIIVPPRGNEPGYITPNEYFIGIEHVCRQSQSVVKKRAISEKSGITDLLTGQPAGDSRQSGLSAPETGLILAAGLTHSANELLTFRGGDQDGLAAMQAMLTKTGSVSLDAIEPYRGGVKSTKTLDAYLKGAHINSTLVE